MAFPQAANDPFNQVTDTSEEVNSSIWQSNNQSIPVAPRWNLKTHEEQQEHQEVIKKLESKLAKTQQKKGTHYPRKNIPDPMCNRSSSSDESEEEEEETHREEEDQEGLPLLWKSKTDRLQNVRKKTEHDYNNGIQRWPRLCIYYCC